MQCVTPMFRLYDISTKHTIRIVSRAEVMQGLELNSNNITYQLQKMNAKYLSQNRLIQTIPCGKCWTCQLNYSAEWATRNMLETLDHEECYFITLTYDDEHLFIPETMTYREEYPDGTYNIREIENDGTWISGSLYPEHVTKFLKDLRRWQDYHLGIKGIRFFYCGEYGEQTQRPHYHMLLYGAHLDPKENYSYHIDKNFKEHWKNKLLDEIWEYGMHDIALVEWSSAAYVSRYCTKKLNMESNSAKWYAENGKMQEMIRMSRMPGIGMKYYQSHKLDIYENDSMVMKTVKGNTGNFKPPKSFDKLFKEEYPNEFKKIEKKRRECAERARRNEKYLSNYTDYEKLVMKGEKVAQKISMLPRNGGEQSESWN